jgi:hypothetical protein
MPSDLRRIALALVATLAAACSSTPAPQTLAVLGNGPAVTPDATPPSVVDANLVKAGYSVMRRRGEILYCRNEVITGQRIGTRICLTEAQIQVEKQNVTKARDLLNQPANRCLGASCNN